MGVEHDFLAGLGVAALAVLFGERLKLAEPAVEHFLFILERVLHDGKHGIKNFFGMLLFHVGLGANIFGDISFGYRLVHVFSWLLIL